MRLFSAAVGKSRDNSIFVFLSIANECHKCLCDASKTKIIGFGQDFLHLIFDYSFEQDLAIIQNQHKTLSQHNMSDLEDKPLVDFVATLVDLTTKTWQPQTR